MSSSSKENPPKALGIIKAQVDSALSEIQDASGKLARSGDDPLIEAARKDLLVAGQQLSMALRKLDRALRPPEADAAKSPGTQESPTRRQTLEAECLKIIAEARRDHGEDICRPLGISPTMDPGLAALQLFRRYQEERSKGGPDPGDTLIEAFVEDLKDRVKAAAAQLGEEDVTTVPNEMTFGRVPRHSSISRRLKPGGGRR